MLLREKYPGKKFEVINVAFTAINSHVILPIARECAAHEGDVWIIYMGNNEMVGPFGATTVFGWRAPPWPYVRLAAGLQRWRTGQGLMELGRKLREPEGPAATWGGMGMFMNSRVAPQSPIKETVYRNFRRNLHDIVRAGVDAGATVLLNTVAVNLKDCPPFASVASGRLSPSDATRFDELYASGKQALAQQNFSEAARLFESAARLDSTPAELQFCWGEALAAQTNFATARPHYQLACDDDALPFRADARINQLIRGEAEKTGRQKLILFDAATALGAGSPTGICGRETFFEHVHFDFDARYRLGRGWAEQIEPLLPHSTNAWPSQTDCEQLLGLSALNQAQVIHYVVERMRMPPLSSQTNNVERRGTLEARMNQLRAQMNADKAARTREAFLKLVELRPEDYFLRENYGLFLELTGDPAAAATQWEKYRDLVPQEYLGHYQMGRLRIAQQRYAEAEASLRIALGIRPSRTDTWIELGNALALQKKYPESLAAYSTALKQDPLNWQTFLRHGKVLADLNRHPEAMESYRRALALTPADALSHHELALELAKSGQQEDAGIHFGQAARLGSNLVAARFDYGAWLLKEKRWDEARQEFEAVVRLEPRNERAQKNLLWLQGANRPKP